MVYDEVIHLKKTGRDWWWGWSWTVESVVAWSGIAVDNTDPANPIVSVDPNLLTSSVTFYATTASSDIWWYTKLVTSIEDPDYDEPAVNVPTWAITWSDQLVWELSTVAWLFIGNPWIITITTIWEIRKTSGGSSNAQFYFKVFHRTSGGTETEIAVSNPTMAITNTVYWQFNTSALLNNGAFDATDRVVIKYYGTKIWSGASPEYEFMFGGSNPVRTLFPVPTDILLTNYYTKTETDWLLNDKQDTLISGTNIKTVNGNSILWSGDLIVGGMIRNQTSDISSIALTLLNTNLTFPVEANSVYALQWWLIGGGNSSGWIRIALSLPAGCSWRHGVGISANINIGITSAISPFAPANNTQQTIYHGTLITGANAGTVTLQFSSAVAGQTWWFRTDSILYISKK